MLVYFDPETAPLKGVPQRLLPKAVQQFGEAAESYGLKPVATPGLPSDAIRVDTRGVKDAGQLTQWLESVNAVVVDVEASDVPALYNHKVTPESLALFRHFPTADFSQLAVEDLNDRIRQSFFIGYTGAESDDSEIGRIQQEDIVKDLRAAGLNVPEGNRLEQWEAANKTKPSDVSPEFLADFTETTPFMMEDNYGGAL
jgi:hypothetical protein